MWLNTTGNVEVTTILSSCLNFDPARAVKMGVQFDLQNGHVITIVPEGYNAGDGNKDWEESVKDGVRKVKWTDTISMPGSHILKIWRVDPAVVVQKILVDCGGLKPSYLGPPESRRVTGKNGSVAAEH